MIETNSLMSDLFKSCCFLGQTPQKLKRPIDDIKIDLENEILNSIAAGYTTFITGINAGTDIWAGNIVIRLKDRFPDLKLIAAIPYPGLEKTWTKEWKDKYNFLLSHADSIKIFSEEYSHTASRIRNQWMIEHSTKLIVVYTEKLYDVQKTINSFKKHEIQIQYLKG